MPIINRANIPTREVKQEINRHVNPVRTTSKIATHLDMDTPFIGLTPAIEGHRWSVDYFNLLRAENDSNSPLDQNLPDQLASYNHIENMILYVDSGMTGTDMLTGSARVSGIIPQQGDVFTAILQGNRKALIRVEDVAKQSFNLTPIYLIEYALDIFIDRDASRYEDLLTKVVGRYVYDVHFTTGKTSIIAHSQVHYREKLDKLLVVLEKSFINNSIGERSYLYLPGTKNVDPYLESFYFSMVDEYTNPLLMQVERTGLYIDFELSPYQALIDQDLNMFRYANRTRVPKKISRGIPTGIDGPYGVDNTIIFKEGSNGLSGGGTSGTSGSSNSSGGSSGSITSASSDSSTSSSSNACSSYLGSYIFGEGNHITNPVNNVRPVNNLYELLRAPIHNDIYGENPTIYCSVIPLDNSGNNNNSGNGTTSNEVVTTYQPQLDGTILQTDTWPDGTVTTTTLPAGTIYLPPISASVDTLLPLDLEIDSIMTKLILDYLNKREIQPRELDYIIDAHYSWSAVDKFYNIPLLMLLIRYYTSTLYSPERITMNDF